MDQIFASDDSDDDLLVPLFSKQQNKNPQNEQLKKSKVVEEIILLDDDTPVVKKVAVKKNLPSKTVEVIDLIEDDEEDDYLLESNKIPSTGLSQSLLNVNLNDKSPQRQKKSSPVSLEEDEFTKSSPKKKNRLSPSEQTPVKAASSEQICSSGTRRSLSFEDHKKEEKKSEEVVLSSSEDDDSQSNDAFSAVRARFYALTGTSSSIITTTKEPFTSLRNPPPRPSTPIAEESEKQDEPSWLRDLEDDDDFDDDQFLPLRPKKLFNARGNTPGKVKTTVTLPSKGHLLIRSTKKILSGKKPITAFVKQKAKSSTQTKKNLFSSTSSQVDNHLQPITTNSTNTFFASTSTSQQQQQTAASIRNKGEAISHITVTLSSPHLHELLEPELEKLSQDGKVLKVKVGEDDDHLPPTITWTASPSLQTMLQSIWEIKGAVRTVSPSSCLLDQILVFLTAEELHRCVAAHISSLEGENPDEKDEDDLFYLLTKLTQKLSASNLTLVIFGLDAYLKGQARRANRQFRRQLDALMVGADNTAEEGGNRQKRKKKTTSNANSNSQIELNLDVIEEMLVDVRMRLHYLPTEETSRSPHFTVQYIDSGEALAGLVWRYSRSLGEAVWRLSNRAAFGDLLFADANPMASIDPSLGPNSKADLWRRQLQQFHGISASAAEAIAYRWPSPRALYRELRASGDPVGLLSGTALSNSRRCVGDEMATKIATFMLTKDGGQLLKSGTCKT